MRSSIVISFILPLAVLACDNPANDTCAAAFIAAKPVAAPFCLTYTEASHTATAGLPFFAAACGDKPRRVSSACSCLVAPTLVPTTHTRNNTVAVTTRTKNHQAAKATAFVTARTTRYPKAAIPTKAGLAAAVVTPPAGNGAVAGGNGALLGPAAVPSAAGIPVAPIPAPPPATPVHALPPAGKPIVPIPVPPHPVPVQAPPPAGKPLVPFPAGVPPPAAKPVVPVTAPPPAGKPAVPVQAPPPAGKPVVPITAPPVAVSAKSPPPAGPVQALLPGQGGVPVHIAIPPAVGPPCVVTSHSGIAHAVATCTNIILQDLTMPPNVPIDLTQLKFGTHVAFAGVTTFEPTYNNNFDPIQISGTNVHITGHDSHSINGNGQIHWNGLGSNSGGAAPDHFIVASHLISSTISNLNIQNWPVHCFSVTSAQGLTISGLSLDNSEGSMPSRLGDKHTLAHNSDGFDVSNSNGVTISDSIVRNQDDCFAVTSGTNILVTRMTCIGGHGLSVGSVGGNNNNVVSGVTFSDSTVKDSLNGVRIKTNVNTFGTVSNIVFSNITLSNVLKHGIDVEQDYLNNGPTGKPTNGVKISDVVFNKVVGTVAATAFDIYILCGVGSCSNFSFPGTSITGGGRGSSCNYPSTGCPK